MLLVQSLTEEKPKAGPPVSLAIPFQKGNPAFHASLENALQRIKADGRLAGAGAEVVWGGCECGAETLISGLTNVDPVGASLLAIAA